ncbi:hypothetical protein A8C56_09745 [Niabella ginsenosidivorans]|uniref:Uncharacterized protein n=1 Tax=Niabella ginsenosidivorans TaxID=1176587 RepID=A0A1A9I0Q1_9BACT|nr:hypothetical protein A8C56_09745 [Niabella ginsenosidivorans]
MRKTAYFVTEIKDLNTAEHIDFIYASKPAYKDYGAESYSDFRMLGSEVVHNPAVFSQLE